MRAMRQPSATYGHAKAPRKGMVSH
jgi:hypothetical protein